MDSIIEIGERKLNIPMEKPITLRTTIEKALIGVCFKASLDEVEIVNSVNITGSKFSKEKIEAISKKVEAIGWVGSAKDNVMSMFAELLSAPELGPAESRIPKQFCIVKLTKNTSSHGFQLGKFYINCRVDKMRLLFDTGEVDKWNYRLDDGVEVADKMEEVVECVSKLTEAQWKTVMSHEVFQPLIAGILDSPIQVPAPVKENS